MVRDNKKYNIPEMARLYIDEKKSIPEVSRAMLIPRSTVRNQLIKHGYQIRTRAEGINYARHKLGKHLLGVKRNMTAEHLKNIRRAREREKLSYESTSLKPNGYIEITNGENKGKSSHVLVMEEFLGRKLRAVEIVHHIDHDKTNNDIDNLCLLTRGGHIRLHRFEEILTGYKRVKKGKS